MITGQEDPDEGQVSVDRGVTIGYFSQDVGDMAGRSAVAEVMDGAGPVSVVAAELHELETAMADPDRMDEMDEIIERYGEVQARFEELDGYALEGRAREVLAGLSFSQEMMDGDVGALSGGWKMRVALARILLMRPDAMLLDEPSNHLDLESLIWLEEFLKNYEGALLMTSHDREFMNRIVRKIVEIDAGGLNTFSGDYEFYEAAARAQREAAAGAIRTAAGDARQGDRLHRTFQGPRLACRAGAEPGEEARKNRPRRAAAPASDRGVRFPSGAALRRGRGHAEKSAQGLWRQAHL